MIVWLLGLVGKLLARPALFAGVLGVIVFGVREFQHHREVNAFKIEITRQIGLYQQERAQRLEASLALSDVSRNRDALASELRRQNDAIGALATKAKAEQATAVLAAVRELQRGQAASEALRQPTTAVPPGAEALNAWLAQRFK